MLEGTDARVHHIRYTPEMEAAKAQGRLRTNWFVWLRRLFVDGAPSLDAEDLGPADDILKDHWHLVEAAQKLTKRGIIPAEDGWGGWLGKYQSALREAALRVEQKEREITNPKNVRETGTAHKAGDGRQMARNMRRSPFQSLR